MFAFNIFIDWKSLFQKYRRTPRQRSNFTPFLSFVFRQTLSRLVKEMHPRRIIIDEFLEGEGEKGKKERRNRRREKGWGRGARRGPSFREFPAEASGNFLRACTRFALTDRYIDIDHSPPLSSNVSRLCEREKGSRKGEQVAREYREEDENVSIPRPNKIEIFADENRMNLEMEKGEMKACGEFRGVKKKDRERGGGDREEGRG